MVVEVEIRADKLIKPGSRSLTMKEVAEKAETHWRDRLVELRAIASGTLVSSLDTWNTEKEAVVVGAFYGKFIDTGTKPFTPPYMPLFEWALWKTGEPEEAHALAQHAQRQIQKRGVKPLHISDYALNELEKELGDIIEKRLLR